MTGRRTILSLNAYQPGAVTPMEPELKRMVDGRLDRWGAVSVLFYERPIHMVEGRGRRILASDGRRYLDLYNNVPTLGHCDPRVADAVHAQMLQANSHSRYLTDVVEAYSERLLALFPAPLTRVAFTCTGSEANDMALRLARAHSGAMGVVVTRGAYHGNTAAVTEISPSSYKRGAPPDHIRLIDAPDPRRWGEDPGPAFAAALTAEIAALNEAGHGFAALVVDTIFSSDGVFADPPGFLAAAVDATRAAGGLFVADEVQPGFGRTGDHFWGFQRHGVSPDIVTLGKPMGGGFPMAGVVSRPGLVERLAEDFGYFNTFAGTPAAAAAGLAVLDGIESDGLMANAARVGARLTGGMRKLAERSALIADIRGAGLYLGVEIAGPAEGGGGNADQTARLVNALRDEGVLIGVAGLEGDTLKIRPPLSLTEDEADEFLEAMGRVLAV